MTLSGSAYGGHTNYSKVNKFAASSTNFATELPVPVTDEVFSYVSSSLIADELRSKTNADYDYKVDRVGYSATDVAAGSKPAVVTGGVDTNHSGLTDREIQYLSVVPGGVTNAILPISSPVGKAIGTSQIELRAG